MDHETGSPHLRSLPNIQAIEAPPDDAIDFVLKKPDPLFPGLLVIGIMPAGAITERQAEAPVPIGSGPFAVDTQPTETVLTLRRSTDGQRVEFVTIADATVRALKILHGEIDLMQGSMTPELVDWLDRRDGIQAVHRAGTTFTYLGFNLNDPSLSDIRLRRAIAHAIDRDMLTAFMFGGRARLAQAIFPPTHWAGTDALTALRYDPAEARRLLSELGYGVENPLSLTYKTSSDHFRLRVATAIQDQLAQVGIRLAISSFDWGTFYADVKSGRFEMFSLSWVGLKQPDIFRYAFHSKSVPPMGANRGRYAAPEVDELIEAAEASADLRERAGLYARIQRKLLDDLPYVPLWYEDNILIYRDSIENYDTGVDGYYDALATTRRVTRRD
jgi:peptide/nickel transport system substrate-binding protein